MRRPISSAWYDFKGKYPGVEVPERRAFYQGAYALLKVLTQTKDRDTLMKDILRDLTDNNVDFDMHGKI